MSKRRLPLNCFLDKVKRHRKVGNADLSYINQYKKVSYFGVFWQRIQGEWML
jgi:hypothetical protein